MLEMMIQNAIQASCLFTAYEVKSNVGKQGIKLMVLALESPTQDSGETNQMMITECGE